MRIHAKRPWSLALSLALAALLPGTALAQTPLKVGVFDAERASQQTERGQQLYRELTSQGEQYENELRALQEALSALQEQYQSASLSMSEEKRSEMERDIERKQIELQTKQQTFLRERQRDVEKAQLEWSDLVRAQVEALGREGGYDMLLPAELVPYFSQTVDVTDELVDWLGRASAPPPAEAP